MNLLKLCLGIFMQSLIVLCQPDKFSWSTMKSVFKVTKVPSGQLEAKQFACNVDITKDLSSSEPIFIQNGTLMIPQDGEFYWKEGESSQIFCGDIAGGAQNEIIGLHVPSITITCVRNKMFKLEGRGQKHIQDVSKCKFRNTGNIRTSVEPCTKGNGKFLDIGFKSNSFFVEHIEVCFNVLAGTPIYTKHNLYGQTIFVRMQKHSKKPVLTDETPLPGMDFEPLVGLEKLSSEDSQRSRFHEILGENAAQKYLNTKEDILNSLIQASLVPAADEIFLSWQTAAGQQANLIFMWKGIALGNWASLEKSIRSSASNYKAEFIVYTGVHEILELKNDQGSLKKITMSPSDSYAVPKFIWKTIKHKRFSMAFVTLNNPYAVEVEVNELLSLCPDIPCDSYLWFFDSDRKNVKKGYTICCKVIDLAKSIPNIPVEASTDGNLYG